MSDGKKAWKEEADACAATPGCWYDYITLKCRFSNEEEWPDMLEPFSQVQVANPVPPASALDIQVGGDHYKDLKIQPAEFLRQLNVPHLEGEAIYRILRHKHKGKAEDIDKAIHTLQIIRELDYGTK